MTIPLSGTISSDMILNELRVADPQRNYPISTDQFDLRLLCGKGGYPIKLPDDIYGKSITGPLSATGISDSAYADSRFGGGSVSCSPRVNVSGGSGNKSYQWSVLSSSGVYSLTSTTSQACVVSATYTNNPTGSAFVSLRCVVSDSTGSITVNNIYADLQWEGSL